MLGPVHQDMKLKQFTELSKYITSDRNCFTLQLQIMG